MGTFDRLVLGAILGICLGVGWFVLPWRFSRIDIQLDRIEAAVAHYGGGK